MEKETGRVSAVHVMDDVPGGTPGAGMPHGTKHEPVIKPEVLPAKSKVWWTYQSLSQLNNEALDAVDEAAEVLVGAAIGIVNILAMSTLGLVKVGTRLLRLGQKAKVAHKEKGDLC